ncbi:hypothetical protein [Delftia sp. PS-11]|uniref:hypothetical protein n=1 Tax=Delftia sp. PS-11 TaxID=2767222 RepID=UPI0024580A34|nr:hypothetical protein [Delftia sp. PS-11]KAJ8744260.1 hypothetical protein H9T68_13530 [Delftia sp. PS-11]
MTVATADATHQPPVAPTDPRSFTFQMPLFRPGTAVTQNGKPEKVSHVILRRRELMVYLVGHEDPVRPDRLSLTPSLFTTQRRPQPLTWIL